MRKIVEAALSEDACFEDPISLSLAGRSTEGVFVAKEDFVFCGRSIIELVYRIIDSSLDVEFHYSDGDTVGFGNNLGTVRGSAAAIMKGERVALNFAQRLSGIATLTRRFIDTVHGTGVKICDTRKTTPVLRYFEKFAVRCGGGANHRYSLLDGVIVKDNVIRVFGSIQEAVFEVRKAAHHLLKIEVEVENLAEFHEALQSGVDAIMLDNMTLEEVREAVSLNRGRVLLEVSGNISLNNVRGYAEAGVDIISIGSLTHSAPSVDISLEVV